MCALIYLSLYLLLNLHMHIYINVQKLSLNLVLYSWVLYDVTQRYSVEYHECKNIYRTKGLFAIFLLLFYIYKSFFEDVAWMKRNMNRIMFSIT